MSTKFYPLRVKQIEKTTADCAVISLDIPVEWQSVFQYQQGQHLTVKADIDGVSTRRSYSLCSSPVEQTWRIAVKKVPRGVFSTFANGTLQIGDTLEVMPPNGRFYVQVDPTRKKHYVAFAAGSGITPIFSIIKTHLQLEPHSTFQLFYINRSTASMMLREDIEALKNTFLDRFEVFYFLTREERNIPLFNGRITPEKLDIIFKVLVDMESTDDYFICGPAEMIFLIRDYLLGKGIDSHNIHFELFNTSGLPQNGSRSKPNIQVDGSLTTIKVMEGGKSFSFQTLRGSESILESALRKNADLPFACKGGVCCTCKAKLLEGQVNMDVNYGLEQEQLEAGYILTCQAVPISEKVVVDYDG